VESGGPSGVSIQACAARARQAARRAVHVSELTSRALAWQQSGGLEDVEGHKIFVRQQPGARRSCALRRPRGLLTAARPARGRSARSREQLSAPLAARGLRTLESRLHLAPRTP